MTAHAPPRVDPASLEALLAAYPATRAAVDHALAVWPEHRAYLWKSFAPRSELVNGVVERAAEATLKLMAGREAQVATDYRWTCDQLRDEELFFHREGRYRRSTFAEAHADVYSDHRYMARYVNGLLLSQIFWYNHAATLAMLETEVLAPRDQPFDYLEIGPGHGLMCAMAAAHPRSGRVEAWDVSAISLAETREALATMGVTKPVVLREVDVLAAEEPPATADLIVISEVLEHLEQPDRALQLLRRAIAPNGVLFVNVPLNSPSPDHIYLLSHPDEVTALVEGAGFRIERMDLFATLARPIEKALKTKVSVSAGVIARPA